MASQYDSVQSLLIPVHIFETVMKKKIWEPGRLKGLGYSLLLEKKSGNYCPRAFPADMNVYFNLDCDKNGDVK